MRVCEYVDFLIFPFYYFTHATNKRNEQQLISWFFDSEEQYQLRFMDS
jgi:hypothetical protein